MRAVLPASPISLILILGIAVAMPLAGQAARMAAAGAAFARSVLIADRDVQRNRSAVAELHDEQRLAGRRRNTCDSKRRCTEQAEQVRQHC